MIVYLPVNIDDRNFCFSLKFRILPDVVLIRVSVELLPTVATALRHRLKHMLFLSGSLAVMRGLKFIFRGDFVHWNESFSRQSVITVNHGRVFASTLIVCFVFNCTVVSHP